MVKKSWIVGLLLSTLAFAQDGTVATLSFGPGFEPDPYVENVVGFAADVELDISAYVEGCIGFIAEEPDFVLILEDDFPYLSLLIDSPLETSIVLYSQEFDEWYCDATSGDFNPLIDGSWAAGTYEVYVGLLESAVFDYDLYISEFEP